MLHTCCSHARTAVNSDHQLVLRWHFPSILMTFELIHNSQCWQKVTLENPYTLSKVWFFSAGDPDIVYYLVLTTCSVTHARWKLANLLEDYNYFLSGWIQRVNFKIVSEEAVYVVAEVAKPTGVVNLLLFASMNSSDRRLPQDTSASRLVLAN